MYMNYISLCFASFFSIWDVGSARPRGWTTWTSRSSRTSRTDNLPAIEGCESNVSARILKKLTFSPLHLTIVTLVVACN